MPDNSTTQANRLIDEMLAAQTRFAQAWRDGTPPTEQQRRDAAQRDEARSVLLSLIDSLRADVEGAAHNRFFDQRDGYFEGLKDG